MSQYRNGTVKVVSGEVGVIGTGTKWLTYVESGDLFKLRNGSVIYEVASVEDDTHLNLSGYYQGTTTSGELYVTARDFTTNLLLPEINAGDVEWPSLITKAFRLIDAKINQALLTTSAPTFSGETISGTTGGLVRGIAEATASITAAATVTLQANVPSGARVIGTQMRVDSALASGEMWNAAFTGGASQVIAASQSEDANTKISKMFDANAATDILSSEADIAIQRSSNPGVDTFTAQGTIRAIVYYETFEAMGDA